MKFTALASLVVVLQCLAIGGQTQAATNGYTEDFTPNNAGWRDTVPNPVDHFLTGGFSNSPYVSITVGSAAPLGNLQPNVNPAANQGRIIFRANGSASGGAFTGNWLAAGITRVDAYLSHSFDAEGFDFDADLHDDMRFYLRMSKQPGQAGVLWSTDVVDFDAGFSLVSFEISATNYNVAGGPGADFVNVMSSVAEFQIGAVANLATPTPIPSVNVDFHLDHISLVPEPSSAVLALGAAIASAFARRRSR